MDQDGKGKIEIVLSGRFRVVGPAGEDLTPRAAKAQACLALLATSSRFERSRAWICDKLWSDRGQEQARSSLRQSLMSIKKHLGASGDILISDRTSIALDPGRVVVSRTSHEEFLEGIDIVDAEWDDWLRQERSITLADEDSAPEEMPLSRRTDMASNPKAFDEPLISLDISAHGAAEESFVNGTLAEMLARGLYETTGFRTSGSGKRSQTLNVRVRTHLAPKDSVIALSLTSEPRDRFVWADQLVFSNSIGSILTDTNVYGLLFQAQDAIVQDILKNCSDSQFDMNVTTSVQRASQRIMTFDLDQIGTALEELTAVCEAEDFAPALGWLLFALRAKYYEDSTTIVAHDAERIRGFCWKALEVGSKNSFVLASVSAVYLRILNHIDEGIELAKRAVRANSSNPFAIDAMASAFYLGEKPQEGYLLSRTAARLAKSTQFAPYFEMSQCVGATLVGKLDEARSLAVSASAISPKLRSAWRFRLALSAHERNLEEAQRCKSMLERYDAGFSLERMFSDPSYPVQSLRSSTVDLGHLRLL